MAKQILNKLVASWYRAEEQIKASIVKVTHGWDLGDGLV